MIFYQRSLSAYQAIDILPDARNVNILDGNYCIMYMEDIFPPSLSIK